MGRLQAKNTAENVVEEVKDAQARLASIGSGSRKTSGETQKILGRVSELYRSNRGKARLKIAFSQDALSELTGLFGTKTDPGNLDDGFRAKVFKEAAKAHDNQRAEAVVVDYLIRVALGRRNNVPNDLARDCLEELIGGDDSGEMKNYLASWTPAGGLASWIHPQGDNMFDARFDVTWLWWDDGPYGETARSYHKRFDAHDVEVLWASGVRAQEANTFHARFKARDIVDLAAAGVPGEAASNYPERFNSSDIQALFENLVSWRTVKDFRSRFTAHELVEFKKRGIDALYANGFDSRYTGKDIVALDDWVDSPRELFEADTRFDVEDLIELYRFDISFEEANGWDDSMSAKQMIEQTSARGGV